MLTLGARARARTLDDTRPPLYCDRRSRSFTQARGYSGVQPTRPLLSTLRRDAQPAQIRSTSRASTNIYLQQGRRETSWTGAAVSCVGRATGASADSICVTLGQINRHAAAQTEMRREERLEPLRAFSARRVRDPSVGCGSACTRGVVGYLCAGDWGGYGDFRRGRRRRLRSRGLTTA